MNRTRELNNKTKLKIYTTIMIPIALYGMKTIRLNRITAIWNEDYWPEQNYGYINKVYEKKTRRDRIRNDRITNEAIRRNKIV